MADANKACILPKSTREKRMFRYVMIGALCLLGGDALAQSKDQTAPPSSTPEKDVTSMEEPSPGDFWTYEVRDEISGAVTQTRNNVVTEVTPTEIGVRFDIVGKDTNGLTVYDRSWNLKTGGPWKFQPHDGSGIQRPLTVGATWSFEGDNVNAGNGSIWKQTGRSKIVAQEAVTTRAGTFDTFRIETVFSRHPTNDPTRKIEITQQTWYAPAIDHWVKRASALRENQHLVSNNTIELVEYGRRR